MELLRRDSALQENKPSMEPSMEKLMGKLQRRPLREEIYESLKNAIIQKAHAVILNGVKSFASKIIMSI